MFRGILVLLGMTLSVSVGLAGPTANELADEFDRVLQPAVLEGSVDYAALKETPGPLDNWLKKVENIASADVESWHENDSNAFYINAYNGHVLRLVRDHYPVAKTNDDAPDGSIQQIPGVWDMPIVVAKETLSLNKVEKEILIKKRGLYKAHFAVNCASTGCPTLRATAYRGHKLGRQLNLAAQAFLRSPEGLVIDREKKVLTLSKIFEWYWADFQHVKGAPAYLVEVFGDRGPMLGFIASYLEKEDATFVREGDYWLQYMPYDWNLNSK